jgi:hypothetical protein
VNPRDVSIQEMKPLRLAEARRVAAGLTPEYIGPVFLALAPKLVDHLERADAGPGTLVHYYDNPARDGRVVVHVGYEIWRAVNAPQASTHPRRHRTHSWSRSSPKNGWYW